MLPWLEARWWSGGTIRPPYTAAHTAPARPHRHHTTHLVLLQSSVNTVMHTQAQYVKKEEAHTVVLHCRITSVWSAKIPSENLQYQAETTCLRINMSE